MLTEGLGPPPPPPPPSCLLGQAPDRDTSPLALVYVAPALAGPTLHGADRTPTTVGAVLAGSPV